MGEMVGMYLAKTPLIYILFSLLYTISPINNHIPPVDFIQNASLVSYTATPTYNFAIAFGALDSSEQCGDDDVFQRSVTQRLSNRNTGPDISAGLEFIVDNEEEESFSSKTSHANKS